MDGITSIEDSINIFWKPIKTTSDPAIALGNTFPIYPIEEINEKIKETRSELADIRFNVRIGREKDYSQIKQEKKNLAVLLTVLKEKEEEDTKKKRKGEDKDIRKDKPDKETKTKKEKSSKLSKKSKNEKE